MIKITLLIILVMIVVPIPIMMRTMIAGRNAYRGILEGSLYAMAGVTFLFLLFWVMNGFTFFDVISNSMNQIRTEDINLNGYPFLSAESMDPEAIEQTLNSMRETATLAIPGMLMIFCLVIAYLNCVFISWWLSKTGKNKSVLSPLRAFSLPRNVIIGSLLIYILSYLAVGLEIIDEEMIMYNMEMLFIFIFSIQGLAILFYLGHRKKVPKIILLVITIILYLTWFGHQLLFLLGLVDIVVDIRKRFSQTSIKM